MRKKDARTRALLLVCAREIANEKGIAAINMRRLAARAGVATGTVYNYFTGKDDVLLALTEDDWRDALQKLERAMSAGRFSERLEETYAFLHGYIRTSAGGLMTALTNAQQTGQKRMDAMQGELQSVLLKQLRQDENVRAGIWNSAFTQEQFAKFVLDNLVLLLRTDAKDAGFFTEIVERILY